MIAISTDMEEAWQEDPTQGSERLHYIFVCLLGRRTTAIDVCTGMFPQHL
jgi:hypothetical protein